MKKLSAITLVETVVYLAIFGVIFLAVMQYVLSVAEANNRARSVNAIQKDTLFVNQHLQDSFNQGTSIDQVNTIFNTSTGVLRINEPDGYFEYTIQAGRLNFSDNGATSIITSQDVTISNFLIERVELSDTTLVGAKITIEYSSDKFSDIKSNHDTSYIFE